MKYVVPCLFVLSIWFLKSCCAGDDCAELELSLKLRFEDSNGNDLIADSTIIADSIRVINIYNTAQNETSTRGVDEESNVYVQLYSDTDIVKIKLEDKIIAIYNVDLTNYNDRGCCPSYENFNVYYDNEFCGDCNGTTLVITL